MSTDYSSFQKGVPSDFREIPPEVEESPELKEMVTKSVEDVFSQQETDPPAPLAQHTAVVLDPENDFEMLGPPPAPPEEPAGRERSASPPRTAQEKARFPADFMRPSSTLDPKLTLPPLKVPEKTAASPPPAAPQRPLAQEARATHQVWISASPARQSVPAVSYEAAGNPQPPPQGPSTAQRVRFAVENTVFNLRGGSELKKMEGNRQEGQERMEALRGDLAALKGLTDTLDDPGIDEETKKDILKKILNPQNGRSELALLNEALVDIHDGPIGASGLLSTLSMQKEKELSSLQADDRALGAKIADKKGNVARTSLRERVSQLGSDAFTKVSRAASQLGKAVSEIGSGARSLLGRIRGLGARSEVANFPNDKQFIAPLDPKVTTFGKTVSSSLAGGATTLKEKNADCAAFAEGTVNGSTARFAVTVDGAGSHTESAVGSHALANNVLQKMIEDPAAPRSGKLGSLVDEAVKELSASGDYDVSGATGTIFAAVVEEGANEDYLTFYSNGDQVGMLITPDGKIETLNPEARTDRDVRDPGGGYTLGKGLESFDMSGADANIHSVVRRPIPKGSIVLQSSDGLLDNLPKGPDGKPDMQYLHSVLSNPLFDSPVRSQETPPYEKQEGKLALPSKEKLDSMASEKGVKQDSTPPDADAVQRRVMHYLTWILEPAKDAYNQLSAGFEINEEGKQVAMTRETMVKLQEQLASYPIKNDDISAVAMGSNPESKKLP